MCKHTSVEKQEEVNGFILSYDMSVGRLIKLVNLGIRQKKDVVSSVRGAFREGNYLGCPGKDIYWGLHKLNPDVNLLAIALASVFPSKPPSDHVAIAACLRYIYGCFDKQGSLLSKQHEKIVSNNDWRSSLPFIRSLEEKFQSSGNIYGLLISHEMEGHRLGDDFVVNADPSILPEMIDRYEKSQSLARQAGSMKHMFTPFYWAACYLERHDADKAREYHWKNLEMMEAHCPDTRDGYQSKASHSWRYIVSQSNKKERKGLSRWLKGCSNKCIKKLRIK